MGNDCPKILCYNFTQIGRLYPDSTIFLYDWGHSPSVIEQLQRVNKHVVVIRWEKAQPGSYMFEKVACINDCFQAHHERPLVYFDSDVIITDKIDELFADDCDIIATWRPESTYKKDEFGTGTWLNAGMLFINNTNVDNSTLFLEEWLRRCELWEDKGWWLDQVELILLFTEADVDMSQQAGKSGYVTINGTPIKCKTAHHTVYNFFPEVYTPYAEYEPTKAKIFHLKSNWRKVKFEASPDWLKTIWIDWVKTNYNNSRLLKTANYKFNIFLRFYLARIKKL